MTGVTTAVWDVVAGVVTVGWDGSVTAGVVVTGTVVAVGIVVAMGFAVVAGLVVLGVGGTTVVPGTLSVDSVVVSLVLVAVLTPESAVPEAVVCTVVV